MLALDLPRQSQYLGFFIIIIIFCFLKNPGYFWNAEIYLKNTEKVFSGIFFGLCWIRMRAPGGNSATGRMWYNQCNKRQPFLSDAHVLRNDRSVEVSLPSSELQSFLGVRHMEFDGVSSRWSCVGLLPYSPVLFGDGAGHLRDGYNWSVLLGCVSTTFWERHNITSHLTVWQTLMYLWGWVKPTMALSFWLTTQMFPSLLYFDGWLGPSVISKIILKC